MRKTGMPGRNELVVCRIKKIYPNSAFAELVEYQKGGMIHVSEVALRWVRNIREFLKENQYVVCRVLRVEGQDISLSVKRVRREEADRKLSEFKRENKAEKLLELVAKKLKKSLETAYKEVGFKLQDDFGSLTKAFEYAVKNPELLKSKGVPKVWLEPIIEGARKSYSEKSYEVQSELQLVCYDSNGIEIIKKALLRAQKESGVEIKYVSSPEYIIKAKGKNYREIEAKVRKASEEIVREINSCHGQCSFKMEEG